MTRRELITLLTGVLTPWPSSAFAKQQHLMTQIALTPEEFHAAYPKLQAWIRKTLAAYEKDAQPIAEKMAYDAEASFRRSSVIFDADKLVAERLARLQ